MSAQQLVLSLCALQGQLLRQIDQSLYVHGISFSEFLVMYQLDNAPQRRLRRIDLAQRIGLTASGVTRLLNPMQKNRLVRKIANPRDARVSMVELTKTGENLLTDATVSFAHAAEDFLRPLNPKMIEQLDMTIMRLRT